MRERKEGGERRREREGGRRRGGSVKEGEEEEGGGEGKEGRGERISEFFRRLRLSRDAAGCTLFSILNSCLGSSITS